MITIMVRDGRTDGWTDGRTDSQKKWHRQVGAPPKKKLEKCFLGARIWAPKPVYRCHKQPEYVTETPGSLRYIN